MLCDRGHRQHLVAARLWRYCNPKEKLLFKTNVGGIDRIARILAGLVLLALTLTGTIGLWGWIGLVPLATGLLSTCPLYGILGFNTCPLQKG